MTVLRFDVFGRSMEVVREGDLWAAYYLGSDGKRRPAHEAHVPHFVEVGGVGRFLADLYHESASPERPDVVELPAPGKIEPPRPPG